MRRALWTAGLLFSAMLFLMTGCWGDDDDDSGSSGDTAADDDAGDDTDDDTDDDTGDDDTGDDDADDDFDDDLGDDDTTAESPWLGVWSVEGTDPEYGPYEGRVEIRLENGEPVYTRSVRFTSMDFDGKDVFWGWEGPATLDARSSSFTVDLKIADWIWKVGDAERTDEDGEAETVTGALTLDGDAITAVYTSSPRGLVDFSETLTDHGESGPTPVFNFDDEYVASGDEMPQPLKGIVWALLSDYHALPFYDDYRDREDFQTGIHFMPHFRTDFDWYRANPDALRVANHVIDEISLTETDARAVAYGPTLRQKAEWFDEFTQDKTVMDAGMLAVWIMGTDPPEHESEYDSALWTGTYVASQFYRYEVTGEQEALDNAVRSLKAILMLVDITDDPTTFARTVRPHLGDDPPAWYAGSGDYAAWDWRCCGNNDMLKGVALAYTMALTRLPQIHPEHDDIIQKIAQQSVMLLENNDVVMDGEFNEITMSMIAFLATGDTQYQDRYRQLFNPVLQLWTRVGSGMFYIWGITDWSGQHLNTASTMTGYLLLDALHEGALLANYKAGWLAGMRTTAPVRNTLWPIAAFAFGNPGPGYDAIFEDAIWGLREVPYPKFGYNVDKRIDPSYSVSPLPSLFWKLDWFDGGRHQGLYGQPRFVFPDSSCLWKGGILDINTSESTRLQNGADYLHAYWLARRYGLLTQDD